MKVITVGRGQDNTIVINDPFVGRWHLEMVQDESGNVQIFDLYSTNGTFVNGKKLTHGENMYLSYTDIIRIGNTTLPWKSYFTEAEKMPVEQEDIMKRKKTKKQREKKTIKIRSIITIIMTIFSLLLMIIMLLNQLGLFKK